jgi:hypothetical protein
VSILVRAGAETDRTVHHLDDRGTVLAALVRNRRLAANAFYAELTFCNLGGSHEVGCARH